MSLPQHWIWLIEGYQEKSMFHSMYKLLSGSGFRFVRMCLFTAISVVNQCGAGTVGFYVKMSLFHIRGWQLRQFFRANVIGLFGKKYLLAWLVHPYLTFLLICTDRLFSFSWVWLRNSISSVPLSQSDNLNIESWMHFIWLQMQFVEIHWSFVGPGASTPPGCIEVGSQWHLSVQTWCWKGSN